MIEPGVGPVSGVLRGAEHIYRLRVYFEDTDAAGIVYYASYLRMAERARTEMMRLLGADHAGMMRGDGLVLTVRQCAIEYLAPARLDDVLEIRSSLAEIRGASLRVRQTVHRDGDTLARIDLRLACVSDIGRPARFPARLRSALAGLGRAALPEATQRA
ncbi:MAG: YbgC/FadM family acyl-CoA thioesterase [Defluviicoccus sp.]|nr:YbgC/FadM family acyl-CoA thioesterase [Defluviicoccus sp.]MDE0383657.1 YbgC/FadM family acyl-CoA thioesterase [Defluviicoccus sp.]